MKKQKRVFRRLFDVAEDVQPREQVLFDSRNYPHEEQVFWFTDVDMKTGVAVTYSIPLTQVASLAAFRKAQYVAHREISTHF